MAENTVEYATSSYKSPLHHRIIASMPVEASWIDAESGEKINVEGHTENIGENSTLRDQQTGELIADDATIILYQVMRKQRPRRGAAYTAQEGGVKARAVRGYLPENPEPADPLRRPSFHTGRPNTPR